MRSVHVLGYRAAQLFCHQGERVGTASIRVVVQNQEGSDILTSTFSTARDWHWNPWVTAVAIAAAGVAMWLTHGTTGLLADTGTGGHAR